MGTCSFAGQPKDDLKQGQIPSTGQISTFLVLDMHSLSCEQVHVLRTDKLPDRGRSVIVPCCWVN